MKDIKHLYLAAKNGGSPNSIANYTEAVQEFFNGNPNDYILQLEYIIQSDIGLQTFKPFIEKNGLPISCFDNTMYLLEKCVSKCKLNNKDNSSYKEAISFLESFRQKYIGCFMMEAYFHDQLPKTYTETYYGSNDKGIPNRKLAAGLINKFGEAAIPDVLITADCVGGNAMKTVLQFIENHSTLGNPVICEWLLEAVKDLIPGDSEILTLESKSIGRIALTAHNRNHQIYCESLIMGNNEAMMEYSEDEIKAIGDFISFNEYKLTWADELNVSAETIQKNIYSLYEEYDGLFNEKSELIDSKSYKKEDISDSLIPMLPGSTGKTTGIDEGSQGLINTRNKKTGDIPDYIKRNHNIGYGEDDNHTQVNTIDSDIQSEPTIDDFKRPTAEDMATPYSGISDDDSKEDNQSELTPDEKKAINNFYYYTYNNSLNKNSDSYNKSSRSQDDHSRGKRINSDNISNSGGNESFGPLKESRNPWDLNIKNMNISNDDVFNEGAITTALSIIFFAPIVLAGGIIIVSMISSKIMDKKYQNKTEKLISDILGKKINSTKIYSDEAAKQFAALLQKNKDSIIGNFYKFKESGANLELSPKVFFSFGSKNKSKPSSDECNVDNMLLSAEYITSGLIKESNIEKVTNALNKLSPDIKFGISVDKDLPGDDNGGDWDYFIKAGICEGGPDDINNRYKQGEATEADLDEWMQKQYDKIDKSGYVIATLSMSLAAKKFLQENFNDTGKGSTGNITESAVNNYYQEGLKDRFKKLANRIKGFFTMKKSLANLQRLGTPSVIKTRTPMVLPGINIPIEKSLGNNFKSESFSWDNTSSLDDMFNLELIFTEDTDQIPKLSKNDIRNVVIKLRSKFNAEILFISNLNDGVNAIIGPASVIETDRKTIEKMQSGKSIDSIPSRFTSDTSSFEKVILINPKFMSDYTLISTPKELEMVISHEYGHVLTFHTLTDRDWIEYTVKKNIISSVSTGIGMYDDDIDQITAECNMSYYKLKPERIANEATGVNPAELTYAVFKKKATGKMKGFDLDGIINWQIPDIIIQQTLQASQGKTDFSADEIIKNIDITIDIYRRVISNKDFLDSVIEATEQMKLQYKTMLEAVGDADNDRPQSDHPVKDILTDVDRSLIKHQQGAKRKIQDVQNVGRAIAKPVVRTNQWITSMVNNWKDADENNIKEKMADPRARSNLFSAIKRAIVGGSLLKAGLLLNPVFLFLTVTRGIGKNKKEFRLRNEMISEFKTELEVIEEKIKDADRLGDNKAKYKLMRFKNELNKKLLRVSGGKSWSKII